MSHVDPELLAGHAAGEGDALGGEHVDHLSACPPCAETLDDLRRIVALTPDAVADALIEPPPMVWHRVMTALDQPGAVPDDRFEVPRIPVADSARSRPGGRPARRRVASLLVAALVGLVVGAGGVLLGVRTSADDPQVLARVALASLPGHRGSGSAELVLDHDHRMLRVQVESAVPGSEFRELWLINTDGRRMYSLGALPSDGTGAYALPPPLQGGLDGFTVVDVSLEPGDGNPLHSRNSQVRGTLPT